MKGKAFVVLAVIALLMVVSTSALSGQEKVRIKASFSQAVVPFGVFTDEQGDFLINNDFTFYTDQEYGFGTEIEVPSKFDNLFFIAGAFYHYAKEDDAYTDDIYTSYNLITLEGGGAYAGIMGRLGWDKAGLETSVAAGYYNFDYRMMLSWTVTMLGVSDVEFFAHDLSGVGTTMSLGGYYFYKGIGIHPAFRIMHVGGERVLTMKTATVALSYKF